MKTKNKTETKSQTKIVKKEAAGAMAPWQQELENEARAEAAKEVLGVARISHKGGNLTIDKKPVQGNKLRVAVIDYCFSKAYYAEGYSDDQASTPVCYAFGREEKGMSPHEQAPDKQSAACTGCQWNAFGTAERGNGKRCKDERRMMVILPPTEDDGEGIAAAEVRQITVPPGSLKNFGKYLTSLRDTTATGNIRTVITEIGTEPLKGAYALTFRAVGMLPDEAVETIMERRASVKESMMSAYPVIDKEEQQAKAKANTKRAAKVR